jgi:hypothetical protein
MITLEKYYELKAQLEVSAQEVTQRTKATREKYLAAYAKWSVDSDAFDICVAKIYEQFNVKEQSQLH